MVDNGATLGDLGERRVISEVLAPRYSRDDQQFGDDCALLPSPRTGAALLATTDPCPVPAAHILGLQDPYYAGWLLGTINLSDLAAAGAEPLGFLSSLVLPGETTVQDLTRLLDGLDECCRGAGTQVVGGNLKEGPRLELSGTAVGDCIGAPLSRVGAVDGDYVVVLGDLGLFWAGFLAMQRGLAAFSQYGEPLLRNVTTPIAKTRVGTAIQREGLVTSCCDNSDGLYPSLLAIAASSNVGFMLDVTALSGVLEGPTAVARELGVEAARLSLGWGDWQLVVTVNPENLARLIAVSAIAGVHANVIGKVIPDPGFIGARRGSGPVGELLKLDSQRFAADSWFTVGLPAYIERMLSAPLIS